MYGYSYAPTAPTAQAQPASGSKDSQTLILVGIVVFVIVLLVLAFIRRSKAKENLPPVVETETGGETVTGGDTGNTGGGNNTTPPTTPPPPPIQTVMIKSADRNIPDRCFNVSNGWEKVGKSLSNISKIAFTKVSTWSCTDQAGTGNQNEQWYLSPDGFLEWAPNGDRSGYCCTQSGDSGGGYTELRKCSSSDRAQKYSFQFPLIKTIDGKCMDIRAASNKNDVQIAGETCNSQGNQTWDKVLF